MRLRTASLIVLLLLPASASAEEGRIEVTLMNAARLIFAYPPAWEAKVTGPPRAPALRFTPPVGTAQFGALVMPFPKLNGRPSTDKQLEDQVRKQGTALLKTAESKEIDITRVEGNESSGYLYHLTQRRPDGGKQELYQGYVVVSDWVLHVTLATEPGDATSLHEFLKVIESVGFVPAPKRVAGKAPTPTHHKH